VNYNGSYELKNSKVSFKISNIFDTKYELIQDFPMPGRMIGLSYEMSF
jgi:outer membrane cobalamin receptor